jgi:hypothetical protein
MREEMTKVVALHEIKGFDSPAHFREFRQEMEDAAERGELTRVPVTQPFMNAYISGAWDEKWYMTDSGDVWRLVRPDFPFAGVFEKVRPAPA